MIGRNSGVAEVGEHHHELQGTIAFAASLGVPAAPFLKATLNTPTVKSDPTLRMCIAGYLPHWKDRSVLPIAEKDLFDPSVKSRSWPKSNLVLAISSLEPQTSIPLLARVLRSPDAEDRLAAARFLEYTESPNASPILLSALDDSDRQVQFAVMQSLGISQISMSGVRPPLMLIRIGTLAFSIGASSRLDWPQTENSVAAALSI